MDDGGHEAFRARRSANQQRARSFQPQDGERVVEGPKNGVPVLEAVYVYPIKSCGGISVERVDLVSTGLRDDRRWMLVDEAGGFMSQRGHPGMALISPSLNPERLTVSAPGMPDLVVPTRVDATDTVPVEVWGDSQRGELAGAEADRWFSDFLDFPCRLVRKPDDDFRPVDSVYATGQDQTSFADGFSLLVISEASLEDLNARLQEPVPMNRFRPNLVVGRCEAYAEDGWKEMRVGNAAFRVAEPCPRCAVTTVDQKTGRRGKEPLRTLATYRKSGGEVWFGRNLIHTSPGTIRVGDPVEVTPR